jgi:hypothetical protein
MRFTIIIAFVKTGFLGTRYKNFVIQSFQFAASLAQLKQIPHSKNINKTSNSHQLSLIAAFIVW